jgi:phosphatidylglycerophosphate synthase
MVRSGRSAVAFCEVAGEGAKAANTQAHGGASMQRTGPHLVIDARPRGPNGPLAGELVLGRPVLAHLVDLAAQIEEGPIAVHARIDEHVAFRSLLDERWAGIVLSAGPPPEGAVILRSDRLYDQRRLRRVLRKGQDPEAAVVWRLDRPAALAGADDELIRRGSYQPIGRYWALPPARLLARLLRPTRVRPNALTLASGVLVIGSAIAVAFGRGATASCHGPALALAIALVLDTSDGHLARLQGTASSFGRWLDASLDELGDMALHAAAAWAAFVRDGLPGWLGVGMIYAMGKYLFFVAQTNGGAPAEEPAARQMLEAPAHSRPSNGFNLARKALLLAAHADIRWHLWIVMVLLGRLDLALAAYAAYYPARVVALAVGKVARHA